MTFCIQSGDSSTQPISRKSPAGLSSRSLQLTLIDNDTHQAVALFGGNWDFDADRNYGLGGGPLDPSSTILTDVQDESGSTTIALTHIPEGNYCVKLEALAPDYFPDSYREDHYGYFNNYGTYGQGFLGIDMGANYESFVGTNIILDTY